MSAPVDLVVGYLSNFQQSVTTVEEIGSMVGSFVLDSAWTVPVKQTFNWKQLKGSLQWYDTESASSGQFNTQGVFYLADFALASSATFHIHMEITVEFRGPVEAELSFSRRVRRLGLPAEEDENPGRCTGSSERRVSGVDDKTNKNKTWTLLKK
jgi:hypothetical protein